MEAATKSERNKLNKQPIKTAFCIIIQA